MRKLSNCPDCGVAPGEPHIAGCDVERCSACGGQWVSCDCDSEMHDPLFSRWVGFWPGKIEADALGVDLNGFYRQGYHEIFFIKPLVDEIQDPHDLSEIPY